MAMDELGSRSLNRRQIFWVTAQLNSYFGNLAQCKNCSALLIRFLKNVWKQKVIFSKFKCISKVTFPTTWAGKAKQEGCGYLFKEMDGPTSVFFLVSDSYDLRVGHTRGISGAISQQYHPTLYHSILEALWCGAVTNELLWVTETALKAALEIQGWAGLSL